MTDNAGATRSLFRLVLGISMSLIACGFGLEFYYDYACPTMPDERTGHVYAHLDKFHDRYVYLTSAQNTSIPVIGCLAVACVFISFLIWLNWQKRYRE